MQFLHILNGYYEEKDDLNPGRESGSRIFFTITFTGLETEQDSTGGPMTSLVVSLMVETG